MGVTITATNSKYEFDMGYGGFFNLRRRIALALDKNFGENYSDLGTCHTEEQFRANDKVAEMIIAQKKLDEKYPDVIDFLYASDCEGKASYKTCRKIYNLIKDVDFGGLGFRYAAYMHNDYDEFKEFLKECATRRRNMRWY